MSDIAIRVEGLGKRYRIGARQEGYSTLRETLSQFAAAPFRRWRSVTPALGHSDPETVWALRDVTFEIEQGDVVGVIGRNGAGKSTLLKILSRITEPTEGYAEICGRVGSLLEVGTGFHPELTGRENIYLNGGILGMKKREIDRKFDEIVTFAEVEKFLDTPIKHYSSGMYVRLAFAVAAHLESEILLVDEVLAVGDVAFQKKCLGKMADVAKRGRTVLFVSHNMAAIRKLCTGAVLLEGGRPTFAGLTEPAIERYLNAGASDASSVLALPPGSPDAPGRATSLRFFANRTPQAQFRIGEPWSMSLEFELQRPLPDVSAAVGLSTLTSVPIITYRSKPRDLTPGRYIVEFGCDVPLKSCTLEFAVGLSTHSRTFYYVDGVGRVSITEVAVGEQPLLSAGDGLLLSVQQPEIRALDVDRATG